MRLIDEVRRAKSYEMPWWVSPDKERHWLAHAERICGFIRQADIPVLLVDNVADYYYAGTSQEFWKLDEHFPNIAPPYPVFWTEHRFPKRIVSEKGDTEVAAQIAETIGFRTGWLMFGMTPEEAAPAVGGNNIAPNAKWVLVGEMFTGSPEGEVLGPHGTWFVAVAEDGRAVGHAGLHSWAGEEHNEIMQAYMAWTHPTLLAISFLHCKNVLIEEHPVPPKLAKKLKARYGVTPTAHKTLVIEPLKAVLKKEGRSEETGIAHAMHICRGHFKDYREGRGLFGKYHQMVWTPSIVRGTKGKDVPPREVRIKAPVSVR